MKPHVGNKTHVHTHTQHIHVPNDVYLNGSTVSLLAIYKRPLISTQFHFLKLRRVPIESSLCITSAKGATTLQALNSGGSVRTCQQSLRMGLEAPRDIMKGVTEIIEAAICTFDSHSDKQNLSKITGGHLPKQPDS